MPPSANNSRWLNALLATTALVSAWLLFQVQPMVAKRILPWFGGGTAVWTTTMLFFQTMLLAGYLYAHLAVRWLTVRRQVAVHLALLLAAAALAIAIGVLPGEGWKPQASDYPAARILSMLAACVGLPFVVLASTAPLVQVWFSRANPGRSPYRLYALSNVGSLAALVSYPLAIEPQVGVSRQGIAWAALFAAFAALCGASGWLALRFEDSDSASGGPVDGGAAPVEAQEVWPRRLHQFLWLALPACASVLLLAVTTYLCQDVASIPLLWIAPMVAYLLSFILTFDSDRWYRRWFWLPVAAGSSFAATYAWINFQSLSIQWQTPIHIALLFSISMVCHGELARLRPTPAHLTSFYLCIAAGGALGGFVAGIIAPLALADYYELQLSILAAWVLALLVLVTDRNSPFFDGRKLHWLLVMGALLLALTVAMYVDTVQVAGRVVARDRNFFGVLRVTEYSPDIPDANYLGLVNGRISHGIQFRRDPNRQVPTQYYDPRSGVGLLLVRPHNAGPQRVGVVGLGAGTLAAYARPGDEYVFYDINPQVIEFSNQYFSFVQDAVKRGANVSVVEGDARLSLERAKPQAFDLLALDAFSGDAIPAHLLTLEAFELYLRHLSDPDGVLAVHISNQHLDLSTVVQAAAERFDLNARFVDTDDDGRPGSSGSTWILLQRRAGYLSQQPIGEDLQAGDRADRPSVLWTDDYSNLLQILKD